MSKNSPTARPVPATSVGVPNMARPKRTGLKVDLVIGDVIPGHEDALQLLVELAETCPEALQLMRGRTYARAMH